MQILTDPSIRMGKSIRLLTKYPDKGKYCFCVDFLKTFFTGVQNVAEEVKKKWMNIVGGRTVVPSDPSLARGPIVSITSKLAAALQVPKELESKTEIKPRPKTARTKGTKRRLTGKPNKYHKIFCF